MLKEKSFLFLLIFFFSIAGCSQEVIKPRVMSPPPDEKHTSSHKDLTTSSQEVAIDEFEAAQFYYALGVSANQEGRWREAQEHFEKALDILAGLDIEEDVDSLRAEKFNMLLQEIAEDYKVTLLSLGVLSGESSISAFLERFESIENFKKLQQDFEKTRELPSIEETWREETPIYDVPIEWNGRVENAIIYFQTVGRDAFETYLKRSRKYVNLMQDILKEKGLPLDLVWLCLVESGFNPKAYSWARAMGPWQFIASTGRKYGLKRNWWYDERRDFVKSTYAACDYLSFLYEKFGSWSLALAGYNSGEGRVERSIRKNHNDNFWDLKLPRQTEDYVPLYMAATIIAKNPERYGFNVEYEDPIQFDIVEIDDPMDLKKVAKVVGTSLETMTELNPELLRGVTPPNYPNYKLRVPLGTKGFLAEYLEKNQSTLTGGVFEEHKVKKGETLSYLAKKYGVPLSVIMETNGLTNKHFLRIGQRLMVPSRGGSSSLGEQSSHRSNLSDADNKKVTFYMVKKGETLSDIALKFDTTPDQLKQLNNLKNPNHIKEGQRLRVSAMNADESETLVKHKVKNGETLSYLADKYGVSVSAIMEANHLTNKHRIKTGEYLLIPTSGSGQGITETIAIHTVKKGDTISDLAMKFKTTPLKIKELNGLMDLDYIKPGQKLKIPATDREMAPTESDGNWIIYIVKEGDTLWDIARKFGVLLERLVSWNEVKVASRIKVGDRIRIFQTY
jgi:membrane-bound lytic murein transglycosylase D